MILLVHFLSKMIRLVCGLGNPGAEYAKTRHNIGFMALDQLTQLSWQKKFKGLFAQAPFKGEAVYFLKPQTYMNLSGESVQELSHFFKITTPEILVVYDEIDLPFGEVHLKKGGGLAGHNGLKSIVGQLGKDDFYRIRLGVGRPQHGSVADHVLGEFSLLERNSITSYLEGASKIVTSVLEDGFEKASQKYSRKSLI